MLKFKIPCAVVALLALAALLVSCGSGDDQTASDGGTTSTSESRGGDETSPTVGTTTPEEEVSLAQGGSRLAQIQDRGRVICAGRNDVEGFGFQAGDGSLSGFDIDLCRALAAAVLGDSDLIELRNITAADRGPTIQGGEVDALIRTVTWTTSRDAAWGNFAQTMFYDGQGFLVKAELGIDSALDLGGASVCVVQGTTTELNLQDFSSQNNLGIRALTFEETSGAREAYLAGQCDAYTSDRSGVAGFRFSTGNPADHVILSETISEEPLGPVVPHGDEQWFDVVKTVMSILIYAEAYGYTSASVPTEATENPKVNRLFGFDSSFGQEDLGLPMDVAQTVIRAVGNYGEIYERSLGPDGLGITREGSRNALWADAPCMDCPKGGQIYAAPLR